MANLTGEQRAQVIEVLLLAFPNPMEMLMLLDRLDKNLRAIASTDSYRSDLFLVIKAAEAEEWLEDLFDAATRQNPGSRALAKLAEDYKAWIAVPAPGLVTPLHLPYTYPWESLLDGYRERSPALQRNMRDFLLYYLGTPQEPAPFGGRNRDLERLQSWLDDPDTSSYAALVARAGMGKSTLLAHWISGLAARRPDDLWIAYYPISIRYSTNTEPDIYGGVAARVARLHGEPPPGVNEANLHVLYRDFLERPVPEGVTLLVILDGLDEKAGAPFGETLAPPHPPPHLRFLVSARPLANDRSAGAWPRRLGWRGRKGQLFELERLNPGGLAEVLHAMGDPLEHLAGDPELVQRLYALSEGDPLLVRLYVDALAGQGDQAAWLNPADLKKLDPGLDAYFEQWFGDQARLWGSDAPLHEPLVKGFVDLCATALGPLRQDDLYELGQGLFASGDQIESTADILTRFLTGDGIERGYAFTHPRLGEYFARRHTKKERDDLAGRFLAYGERVVQDLNRGAMLPEDAPEYVLRYYGAHLEKGRSRTPPETYSALLSDGWRRAWEALEGTPDGFLADAQRAWESARIAGPSAVGQVVRAALCFASVASLSGNLPPELLRRAVETGVLSLAQAEVYARRKTDPEERILALSLLANQDNLSFERLVELVEQALFATLELNKAYWQVEIFTPLVESLPTEMLPRALEMISQASNPDVQSEFLTRLANQLPPAYLLEALAIAGQLPDSYSQVRILKSLAPYLSADLASRAVDIALKIPEPSQKADVLAALAGYLDPEQKAGILRFFLTELAEDPDEGNRVYGIEMLCPVLPAELHVQALEIAGQFEKPYHRGRALALLAPLLAPERRSEILPGVVALIPECSVLFEKANLMADVIPLLPSEEKHGWLSQVGDLLPALEPYYELVVILKKVGQQLPGEALRQAIPDRLNQRVLSEVSQTLAVLAPYLEHKELEQALQVAGRIDNRFDKLRILEALAPFLDPDLLAQALELVRQIDDHFSRTRGVACLAPYLSPAMIANALEITRNTQDTFNQAEMLGELAPYLPPDLVPTAFEIAGGIDNDYDLGKALANLGPNLSQPQIIQALESIRAIALRSIATESLVKLMPYLPPELVSEALGISRRIGDSYTQANTFARLATELPPQSQELSLTILEGSQDAEVKQNALINLAADLPDALLRKAIEIARTSGEQRDETLSGMAIRLAPSRIETALEISRMIGDPSTRAYAVSQLAEHLSARLLEEEVPNLLTLEDENARAFALTSLVPYLPESLLAPLLEIPVTLEDASLRVSIQLSLAARIPQEQAESVLADARRWAAQIPRLYDRTSSLLELTRLMPPEARWEILEECLGLIPQVAGAYNQWLLIEKAAPELPPELLPQAVDTSLAIKDGYYLADALVTLAPLLPADLIQRVLDFAGQMVDPYNQSKILVGAAAYLNKAQLDQAVEIIRQNQSRMYFVDNLVGLAPFLEAEHWEQIQAILAEIDEYGRLQYLTGMAAQFDESSLREAVAAIPEFSEYYRAQAIIGLAPHLPQELVSQALQACETIGDPADRVLALASLIPRLPEGQVREVLGQAFGLLGAITDPARHAQALSELIVYLAPADLAKTLPSANQILAPGTGQRDAALERYTRLWPEICQAAGKTEHAALSDLLERLTPSGRELVLEVLAAFAPVIARLGGEGAVLDCLVAIRDVTTWWP